VITSRHGSKRLWRQLVGCIATYALVLQGVLFALSAAQLAATSLAGDQQNVELCLHDATAAPGLPDQHHDGKTHCPLCLAAAHQILTAPDAPLGFVVRVSNPAPWSPGRAMIAAFSATRSHQPRGPPLAV
jgi:DUF2946 family protein